jgi:DNA polymerase elongation subunit (family B)
MSFYTNIQSWGRFLYIREIDKDGNRQAFKLDNFHPRVWIPNTNNVDSPYTNIAGESVVEFDAGPIRECNDFVRNHSDIENFEIYGVIQPQYQYITASYEKVIPWQKESIIVSFLDIETTCEEGFPDVKTANEQVVAITISFSNIDKKLVFGFDKFTKEIPGATFIQCTSEEDLLQKFLQFWENNTPDILSGWNLKMFDVPYLVNRITRLFGENQAKRLSPWKIIKTEVDRTIMGDREYYVLFGVSMLDYLDLYKKFTYTKQESYTLNHICSIELGQKKMDYSEFGSLHLLYKNDYEKFIEYNIHDVELLYLLEDKMKLIELAITMAYDAKTNFEDVFAQLRMWDVIIYNYLLQRNIVIPGKEEHKKEEIAGGYVKEPIPGLYNWVVSFDLQSLYPHLIMNYNISPDTIVDKHHSVSVDKLVEKSIDLSFLKDLNYTITANGQLFDRRRRGFLPELMDWMFDQRKTYKKKMIDSQKEYEEKKFIASSDELKRIENDISKYNNLQMAKKISLNSAYGAIANNYFRLYDKRIAEGITLSGQLSIKWIAGKLNKFLNKILETENENYCIAIDTDSVYLNLETLVSKFISNKSVEQTVTILDKICQDKIVPFITKSYEELARYMNAYEQKMIMKREAIADRGIWTAKKRYILNVHDSEGVRYSEPKLKIMGIEAVRSSTPGSCRSKIKEALKIIMKDNETTLIQFIEKFKKEFFDMPVEDIAFPRSVNNLLEYSNSLTIYRKGTPIHVRGSLLFNHLLEKNKLTQKYTKINEGEKIKFVYLKMPNPIRENVIAFSNILPEEFGLHEYIDYSMQFEKTFTDPLSKILDVINWNYERRSNLDLFFSE